MVRAGLIAVLVTLACVQVVRSGPKSERVMRSLRRSMDPDVISIADSGSNPVKVGVTLSLIKLLDVDKEHNELEVLVWETLRWQDPRLTWDTSNPETNVTQIHFPASHLWIPDITLYNSVKTPEVLTPKLVVVDPHGGAVYVPSKRMRSYCDLQNVDSASGVNCTLIIGSWTYSGFSVMLEDPGPHGFTVDDYREDPSYTLLGTSCERSITYYPCCPEPYPVIKFNMTLQKRGSGFFSW